MISTGAKFLCLLSILNVADGSRTYVDSKGVTHVSDKTKPSVVMFAHKAVSLKNYGLAEDQLVGVLGEFYNSGSDIDLASPSAGSSLPADPLYEDIQFLEKAVHLSPGCKVGHCTTFDLDTFLSLDVDEFIMQGYRGAWWGFNETYTQTVIEEVTKKIGKQPIYIELSKDGAESCSEEGGDCPGLSMIDIIESNYELAKYLDLDIPESLNQDRQQLCVAAKNFQNNMKTAQDKGLRVMAAYLTTTLSYYANPVSDMVLRMFEELGMPILHVGKCKDAGNCSGNYFWEYVPIETYFQSCVGNITASCNSNTFYPVDFWLYDHRTTLTLTNPDFSLGFPDKAIINGQMGYWPIGGRLLSPSDAAEILNIVGPQVAGADRIRPMTECTPDLDVTGEDHRKSGLAGGEYACYNEAKFHNTKYFKTCNFPIDPIESPLPAPTAPTGVPRPPTAPTPSSVLNTSESSSATISGGASLIFGIMAGLAVL